MSIRNKVQLVGRTGIAPDIKVIGDNKKLAKISLATNENYKNKAGEWIENTTWHNLVAWGDLAERIEKYVSKGCLLMIEGKLVNRQYNDKENNSRYITEVEVRNFILLEPKRSSAANELTNSGANKQDKYDDDLPF
ncbi:MAG: single-stranded DNA-binding protein [Weeksellaceae bacterium]